MPDPNGESSSSERNEKPDNGGVWPKRIAQGLVGYAVALIGPAAVGVLGPILLTRLLAEEGYGYFSLGMSIVAAVAALSSWAGMAVVRYLPANVAAGTARSFAANAFRWCLLSALVASAAPLVVLLLFGGRSVPSTIIIASSVAGFLGGLYGLFLEFARAREKPRVFAVYNNWRTLGGLTIAVLLVAVTGGGAAVGLAGVALGLSLALPALGLNLARDLPRDTSANGASVSAGTALAYGLPLTAAAFADWGLRLSDRWILQYARGPEEVAVYSAAYGLAEASVLGVVMVLQLGVRPLEVRVWETRGGQDSPTFATSMTRIYLLLAMPVACLASVLSVPLLSTLLPASYVRGAPWVPLIAWGVFFLGLQQRYQAGAVLTGRTASVFWGAAVGFTVNLILNILFVRRYGASAAAVTTLIGYVSFFAVVAFASRRHLRWSFPGTSLRNAVFACVGSSGAAFLCINILDTGVIALVVGGVAGLGVYVLSLLMLDEVSVSSLRRLLRQAPTVTG